MKYLLFICLLTIVLPMSGQSLSDKEFQNNAKYRVKLLDEFMARFNGEETHEMIAGEDSLKKDLNLLYLMDSEMFAANRDSMQQLSNEFADSIHANRTKLFFDDGQWFAEVKVNCTYENKTTQITLYLRPEEIKPFQHRWVIVGAQGGILALTPSQRNHGLDILPNNHEVGFMALPKIHLFGNDKVLNYSAADYRTDQLTAFYTMIYTGVLKMNSADEITYHFLEVPGFAFTVKRQVRKGFNSGWLISQIKKIDDTAKFTYYQKCISE